MEMDAVHHARRRSGTPAGTLYRLASPLLPRTLRRYRGMDGERVVGSPISAASVRRRRIRETGAALTNPPMAMLEPTNRPISRSADHGRIAIAHRDRLASLNGRPNDLDPGGGVGGGGGVAGRHAYEQYRNRSDQRNCHDFNVGGSVCSKHR